MQRKLRITDLEDLLVQHPDINDAAVIGVYDETQATEVPKAYGGHHVLCGPVHADKTFS